MDLHININAWLDKTPAQIREHIKGLELLPLSELKFLDLLARDLPETKTTPSGENADVDQDDLPDKAMRHGVYVFFDDKGECLFVGKSTAAHFAQTLGWNFAMSPTHKSSFIGKLVKHYFKEEFAEAKGYAEYVRAVGKIGGFGCLLIAANQLNMEAIDKLEKLLIKLLHNPDILNERDKNFKFKGSRLSQNALMNSELVLRELLVIRIPKEAEKAAEKETEQGAKKEVKKVAKKVTKKGAKKVTKKEVKKVAKKVTKKEAG